MTTELAVKPEEVFAVFSERFINYSSKLWITEAGAMQHIPIISTYQQIIFNDFRDWLKDVQTVKYRDYQTSGIFEQLVHAKLKFHEPSYTNIRGLSAYRIPECSH
jgi:hypothetical protein